MVEENPLSAPRARRRHLLLILLIILPLYTVNARWGIRGNPDALAAALPAYELARGGGLDLSNQAPVVDNLEALGTWYLELPSGEIVSNRAPGLILLATPAYAVASVDNFSNAPATVVALTATVLAMVVTWLVLIELIGLSQATVAAITLAIGTTTWWVSSSELWPHGPGQLWAALAILSLSKSSILGAGVAFTISVTTRPLTALFAFITGISESIRARTVRPAVLVGALTSIGLTFLVLYNRFVFGSWSIRGGYGDAFTTGAVDRFSISAYLQNVWNMFLGLPNGIITTTPIIALALAGSYLAWGRIPGWAKSTALAGLVYLLVHAALNRASGGSLVFYRYPLEAIVMAAPLLAVSTSALWNRGGVWRWAISAGITTSIALQFAHVFLWSCAITDPVVRTCILS